MISTTNAPPVRAHTLRRPPSPIIRRLLDLGAKDVVVLDELVTALGMTGVSTSQVRRLCADLDAVVERFRTRSLTVEYPHLWLDATYLKVRENRRGGSMAMVIASTKPAGSSMAPTCEADSPRPICR